MERPHRPGFCILLAVASLFLFASPSSAISVFVRANDEQCFMENVHRGENVLVSFSVTKGGHLDIDVKVLCWILV